MHTPTPRRPDHVHEHRITTALLDESGQATTEYALVLLGAALVALLLVAWAGSGGASGKIGQLFDHVLDAITSKL